MERPQQNSVVEHKHQHLLNMARSLYFQSKVHIHFWNECVLTTTFFVNRIPSSILNQQSPFTLFYSTLVDYSIFCTFDCLAFASTMTSNHLKFHPRVRTCVFLGYPPGYKGYKLYDIEPKQIFISRDVIFHENVFPFHSIFGSTNLVDPFPDLVLFCYIVLRSTSLFYDITFCFCSIQAFHQMFSTTLLSP